MPTKSGRISYVSLIVLLLVLVRLPTGMFDPSGVHSAVSLGLFRFWRLRAMSAITAIRAGAPSVVMVFPDSGDDARLRRFDPVPDPRSSA